MELQPKTYYDHSKFPNTQYLVFIEFEKFFANNIFKGNTSRVIYASEEFSFRQRLNLLSKNGTPSPQALDIPFMSYYRQGNWVQDPRVAVQNATVAMFGSTEDDLGGLNIRFQQVSTTFSCIAYFSSDADAQLAYETLYWMNRPQPNQGMVPGLEYKGTLINFPISLFMTNLQFNPGQTENQWFNSNKIYPIKFDIEVKSVILSQRPQSPESTIFWQDESITLTEKVILDFLSYKDENNKDWLNPNPLLELDWIYTANPLLQGVFTITSATQTSLTVEWTWNPLATVNLEADVKIVVNAGSKEFTVPLVSSPYTIEGLSPDSTYNLAIWFFGTDQSVTKYTATGTTLPGNYVGLKGMRGY